MNVVDTKIADLLIIEPKVFSDDRGFFMENYSHKLFSEALGGVQEFVQDNHSRSKKNVLRGLHYQIKQPQGKLVQVIQGCIYDVAVDVRRSSPTFGHWVGIELSGDNHRQLWIPSGFAHGFLVLSEQADIIYKTTDYYAPEYERCIRWDDADIGINWPHSENLVLSIKDAEGESFQNAEVFK
ncbi:MAG: dTDP-4-dehydrorhamnose 3,5-epimerase [Gammaproteobacteria bacterium]|nr:dTDP-4-dehydrorhamnose 3,5-epimerase [Gammaproteobacteria bacterium]